MIETLYGYVTAYVNRPTVVVADAMILVLATIAVVGVITLRRRIDDLAVAIQLLQNKLTRGRDNS